MHNTNVKVHVIMDIRPSKDIPQEVSWEGTVEGMRPFLIRREEEVQNG